MWLYTDDGYLLHCRNGNVGVGRISTNLSSCHVIIAEKSGPVWLGNNQGLYTTGTNNLTTTGPPRLVARGKVDYLVASARGGFWCLAGHIQKWRNFRLEKDYGEYPWPWDTIVTCACEDRDGNLVLGTQEHGVYWGRPDGTFAHLTRDDGQLSDDSILSLVVDSDNALWVGTGGFGLDKVKHSPFEVSYEGKTVRSVCEDAQGGIWVGLYAVGTNAALAYSRGAQTRELCAGDLINSVFADRDSRVWAGIKGRSLDDPQTITSALFEVLTNGLQRQYRIGLLDENITEVRPIQMCRPSSKMPRESSGWEPRRAFGVITGPTGASSPRAMDCPPTTSAPSPVTPRAIPGSAPLTPD